MEELSKIAERIWKLFPHFKDEVTVKKLMTYTGLHKSSIYNALDELESSGCIDYNPENHSWVIKSVTQEKPLKEKPPERQLSQSERQKLETLAAARAETSCLAKNFPSLQPLDDLLTIHKQKRKELGLE